MSVALLPNQLSNALLQVRIAWGADLTVDSSLWTWTDVTSDVMQDNGSGITITLGRANEASVAQPAACTLRLKNQTGAYTPADPEATNYPNVRLGTPVQVRVSLNGGSTWSVRFQGEAAAWSPGWDAQGRSAYVVLAASGRTRRLGQGTSSINSALRHCILGDGPLEYWPLEDISGSTQAASAVSGGGALVQGNAVNFAGDSVATPAGSLALPDFSGGGALGRAPLSGSLSATGHTISFLMRTSASTSTPIRWGIGSGTFDRARVDVIVGVGIQVNAFNAGGLSTLVSSANNYADGLYHFVRVILTQSGANIAAELWVDGTQVATNTSVTVTLGPPSWMQVNPQGQSGGGGNVNGVGHLAIFNGTGTNAPATAVAGFVGETSGARISRLCAEEGIPLTSFGSALDPMGVQGADTLINLLRGCESVDLGYLLDGLGSGLTYVCRSSLYNQAAQITLNANSGQVPAAGPQPTNDDLRLLNRVTVTRVNGSFVVVEDANGPLGTHVVGVHDNRYVVNPQSDSQLNDIGGWIVHLGTVEGMRYPQIVIDLAAAPELASTWVGAIPTDRVDVTNLGNRLTQHPQGTVSLLAEGWTETLNARQWKVMASCSAFRPWEVFTIQDTRLGRIESDGSSLNSSATTNATSLSVASSGGVWDTGSTPFDVDIEGEQVTVTAVTGSSSPQTFTVTRSVNGVVKAHNSAVTVKLWRPGVLAL